MNRLNTSKKLLWLFYIGLFAFMLLCNVLTMKVADDFAYLFSWADGSRITNPSQIIPSMAAHMESMNGRLIAHGVAQFWLMLPDWMFDIANSLVFVLQIPLIVRICKREEEEQNNLLHVSIFCAMWLCEMAFGEANLWLDGACNYLWSVPVGLLFIQPYVRYFMSDDAYRIKAPKVLFLVLFLVLSFVMGAWVETGSAGFIFIAAALLVLGRFWQHKSVSPILLAGLALAVVGYLSIYMAPAQWNKGSEMSIMGLAGGLLRCLLGLCEIWVLVAAFAVLLFLNLCNGTDRKRLVLAGVLFVGAMGANFILIFAAFYAERSVIGATVLLICADALLAQNLFSKGNYRTTVASIMMLLVITAPVYVVRGAKDIYDSYSIMKNNEEYIYRCIENGQLDIVVPTFEPGTKYSAAWDLRYVMEDPAEWPNNSMARFYGIDTIVGKEP